MSPDQTPVEDLLLAYADGELDDNDQVRVEAALAEDARLQQELAALCRWQGLLREQLGPADEGRSGLDEVRRMRVLAGAHHQQREPWWPRLVSLGTGLAAAAVVAGVLVSYLEPLPRTNSLQAASPILGGAETVDAATATLEGRQVSPARVAKMAPSPAGWDGAGDAARVAEDGPAAAEPAPMVLDKALDQDAGPAQTPEEPRARRKVSGRVDTEVAVEEPVVDAIGLVVEEFKTESDVKESESGGSGALMGIGGGGGAGAGRANGEAAGRGKQGQDRARRATGVAGPAADDGFGGPGPSLTARSEPARGIRHAGLGSEVAPEQQAEAWQRPPAPARPPSSVASPDHPPASPEALARVLMDDRDDRHEQTGSADLGRLDQAVGPTTAGPDLTWGTTSSGFDQAADWSAALGPGPGLVFATGPAAESGGLFLRLDGNELVPAGLEATAGEPLSGYLGMARDWTVLTGDDDRVSLRYLPLARPPLSPAALAAALAGELPPAVLAGPGLVPVIHLATGADLPVRLAAPLPRPATAGTARPQPAGRGLVALARANGQQLTVAGGGVAFAPEPRVRTGLDRGGLTVADFTAAFATRPFADTAEDPQLTLAIDADTGSWERARAQLASGQRPDPFAIQAEHFVNAVPMGFAPPTGDEAFALYAEAAPAPFAAGPAGEQMVVVALGVVGRQARPDERRPLHLTLCLDTSASMARGGALGRVRNAVMAVLERLDGRDSVALVTFGERARLLLPPTPGDRFDRFRAVFSGLAAKGATAAVDGLALAYQVAAEEWVAGAEHRVLFATDGATLAGDGVDAVLARASELRGRIDLTVLGAGGADYPAAELERLADHADGEHRVIADPQAAATIGSALVPARLQVLARDAKVQATWNPARVAHARLVGFEERRLEHHQFRDDGVDAGELSWDSRVTALFELVLHEGGSGPLGTAAVRYHDTRHQAVRELSCELPGAILASEPTPRLAAAACAAALAEHLRAGWWDNCRLYRPSAIARLARRTARRARGELAAFCHALATAANQAAR